MSDDDLDALSGDLLNDLLNMDLSGLKIENQRLVDRSLKTHKSDL